MISCGILLAYSLLDVVGTVLLAATFVLVIWKIEQQRGRRPQLRPAQTSSEDESDAPEEAEFEAEPEDEIAPEPGAARGNGQAANRSAYVPMLPPRSVRRGNW